MTDLPLGMKYYLLILTSSLIEDLNDYGVKWIANEPGIAIRDVEKAFFCARALESRMPDEPGQADPRLWPELMKSIHTIRRVLDVVEKTTFDAVIAEVGFVDGAEPESGDQPEEMVEEFKEFLDTISPEDFED